MAALKLLRRRLEPGDDWFRRRLPGREAAWQEAVSHGMWRLRWSLRDNGQLWTGQVASCAVDGRWRELDPCWRLVTVLTPGQLKAVLDVLADPRLIEHHLENGSMDGESVGGGEDGEGNLYVSRRVLLLNVLRAQGYRV